MGEVGGFSTTVRGRRLYLVEAAEKGMAWMRLTATGNAGHGSMRHPDNAVTHLAEAVARIGRHPWPVQLTPTMKVLLAAVFAVLGVLPLVVLAQLGTVICIGVLLDTLVVRTVLVPALALTLGDRFWWPRSVGPASRA